MTSLFDFADATESPLADTPIDLISAGGRGISVLEFFVLEDTEREHLRRDGAEAKVRPPVESAATERAQQIQVMIEAARTDAFEEARLEFNLQLERRLDAERARVEQVASEFAMDRQRYFAAAEAQVVKLAIAVASRVLAREVEADPMHLAATVRAALARVRSDQLEQWEALFANSREGSVSVVGDEHMEAGECMLQTDVGRVELGVKVQLAEIERGFGELLRRQGE